MKRGHKIYPFIWFFVLGLSLLLGQQSSSYLTQKLMVESDLRSRIASALSKIIDDQKYVIDVDVNIEVTGEKEEQITIIPSDRPIYDEASALEELTTIIGEAAPKGGSDPESEFSSMGLPIPGFDFEVEAEPQVAQENSNEGQRGPGMVVPIQEPGNTTERVQSKTLTKRVPAIAAVKRLQISIILQEGAAPELIENIRQVVMVASRFDRTRGDVLSIMTASFKERRDEKSAEQVLLKNIADKLEMLQSGEGDDALTKSIEKEISGPLLDLKEQLNNLERRGAADKFEFERKTALLRDSLQLRALKEEITSLKNELSYANDARVDSQLTNRIATLDSMQMGLGQEIEDVESSSALIILVSILGALVVVLLVLVVILLLKKKQGPQQPQMPMPWPYPPPPLRRKKKRKSAPVANNEAQDDPDVIRGEIGEMRQSVVSMSVGQPKTATRIVKEWLEDDVVPEPEPPPEEPEEDSDKKKKKKK
ncbi:MAG: flagellar M-ring protein FliF C-terminal domain-containing protein [Candidatus Marinimicrobia bacterium]|jgi:flagellar biosynthesis/type III secretory pathway M-ring protein FliF/YscJ|nr:flagellar M-ring protein FliF C-terminal domain-containing protein [Candidatus Neomarinimicrobiota bacterium]